MEIIALQEYTDKYISLYEGEIRNIGNGLANKLIAKGVVAEHDSVTPSGDGSSSGGGALYLNVTTTTVDGDEVMTLDKTYNEIVAAIEDGKIVAVLLPTFENLGGGLVSYLSYYYNDGVTCKVTFGSLDPIEFQSETADADLLNVTKK